jgi:hypothetical protein
MFYTTCPAITDSNNVSLTLEIQPELTGVNSLQTCAYQYTVSGSPTATYTCTATVANYQCNDFGLAELSGVTGYNYVGAWAGAGAPLSGPITTVSGDKLFSILYNQAGGDALAISNSSGLTSIFTQGTQVFFSYAMATSTTSTASGSVSGSNWNIILADFTGSASPTPAPNPYAPYPPAFRPSGAMIDSLAADLWLLEMAA